MTLEEFRQLRLYSRYDGIYLAVVWAAAFASLILSGQYPLLGSVCMILTLSTPFFVAHRLRLFRQNGLDGVIGYGRALHYCLRVFFNASLLFAVIQWAYMKYVDNGQLVALLTHLAESEDTKAALQQWGFDIKVLTNAFTQVTPLEFATSYLVENILMGIILSIPIALIMKKS